MLIKGITQINQILTPEERERVRGIIIGNYEKQSLKKEDFDNHYDNSFGGNTTEADFLYDRLTPLISQMTGLKLQKANSYSRIYFEGGKLTPHHDRQGLNLTLSIQIENTFSEVKPIFGKGYDGTAYRSDLNDGDSVLIKGRELQHWRETIQTNDPEGSRLVCIFFHWSIVGLQKEEILDFVSPELCKELIAKGEAMGFEDSQVLQNDKAVLDYSSRSSQMVCFPIPELAEKISALVGTHRLEGFQMLKYTEGKSFKPHNDNGNGINHRLHTVIIYLNEEYTGGETKFTNDGYICKPQTGKMIIWKNLDMSDNNPKIDNQAMHEGASVLTGTKYVLVNWVLLN